MHAIQFMYKFQLNQDIGVLKNIKRSTKPKKLPVVFSKPEVKRILALLSDEKKLMVQLLYGSGLRVSEVASIRIKDIDFDNQQLYVRYGKGGKDRTTLLPASLISEIKKQMVKVKLKTEHDIANGVRITLEPSIANKNPSAAFKLAFAYLFPSKLICHDDQGRPHRHGRQHLHDHGAGLCGLGKQHLREG